jgi:2-phosphosulfolactate phosphatase
VTQQDSLPQHQYQVRFDWGIGGARAIADDVDVIVLVDVLGYSTEVDLAMRAGERVPLEAATGTGAELARQLVDHPATVVAGGLRNAGAIARWTLAQQGGKGDRFGVAVIAAGERRDDSSMRFALEDLLGAGAIIEALAEVGIDYYSPEAAAAAAAFTGLRNATSHLIGASESGRELAARVGRSGLDAALEQGSSSTVPILREFGFGA